MMADHSGHGKGKHDQRDMTVPTMPRTRFVMVEAEFILRRFKTVFDRPPVALDPSEGFDRGSLWAPGCEVRSIAIGNVAADQKAASPCAGEVSAKITCIEIREVEIGPVMQELCGNLGDGVI